MWTSALLLNLSLVMAVELQTTSPEGAAVRGSLVSLSAEQVVLQTASGAVTMPVGQLAELRSPQAAPAPAVAPRIQVSLTDGSLLLADEYLVKQGRIEVQLSSGQQITLPTKAVAWVRLRPPETELAAQWQQIAAGRHPGDVIVLRKDQSLDYLEGVLGNVDAETIEFELDGEKFPVKRLRIEGLLYAKTESGSLPASIGRLIDTAGSSVEVARLTVAGDQLEITTPSGAEFTWPATALAVIRFKSFYLSDLPIESVSYTPYIGAAEILSPLAKQFFGPRVDRSVHGPSLRLGGQSHDKGLSLRSRTEVVYRFNEAYTALKGTVGIDDEVRPLGKVRLLIHGDDQVLFDREISGQDEPLPLNLDLTGVRRLKILVDFQGDEVADQLLLCGMRLLK